MFLIAAALLTLTSILLSQVNTVLVTTLSYAERAPSAIASLFSFMGPNAEDAILSSLGSVNIASYLRTAAGQAGNMTQGTVLVILFVGFLFGERLWFGTKLQNFLLSLGENRDFRNYRCDGVRAGDPIRIGIGHGPWRDHLCIKFHP